MALVIQESLRGLFYAPYYAALALGAYDGEGVEVRFVSAPSPGRAPDSLFDGTVDVAWGGPMRVNQMYETRPDCDLVCFAEAVTRDPFILIGRMPQPNFHLESLASMKIGSVSEVPTPWLCLQEDLRRVGVNPEALDRVADRSMPENMAALRAGALDVVQLFQPFAEELIASGDGCLWYAAADRGQCSYTSFYARRGTIAAKRDELVRLVRALYRTQKWLHRQSPDALANVVAPYFPTVARPLLTAALTRYRDLGIWGRDPILPRAGYDRLVAGLVSGGFVRGTPFATAVDNSFAEQAIADDPPPLS
jgi:NitT/TauT family transport system substrate-binding protein